MWLYCYVVMFYVLCDNMFICCVSVAIAKHTISSIINLSGHVFVLFRGPDDLVSVFDFFHVVDGAFVVNTLSNGLVIC